MDFKSYDTFEAMQADMAKMHDDAMAHLIPQQSALLSSRSFYWMRPAPQFDCVIFGYYDLDAWIAKERELAALDPEDSYVDVARIEHNNLERGYKSGRCYSIIEPTGELGDTHVGNMWPITQEAFEQAQAMNWDVVGKLSPISPLGKCFLEYFTAAADTAMREAQADG